MNALALVLGPAFAGLSLSLRGVRTRAPMFLTAVTLIASGIAYREVASPHDAALLGGYIRVDPTARLFLAVINPIFFGISVYIWNRVTTAPVLRSGIVRTVAWSLALLASANAVLIANHFLFMWIALELTALVAAPLIIRNGVPASRVASFRYLLFSCVGLGLVLLGFICIARAIEESGVAPVFFLDRAEAIRTTTANTWGQLGLALIILGLCTKLGLAPMYSWLPEAYDEAPPAVTALLGAVQFNAALVFLMRIVHVFRPVHPSVITSELLTIGFVSLVVSTFNIIATRNMKRLVAYASINHAGVIAIGLGIGKVAAYGLLLYVISNAFIKAILFLTAGKIKANYGTEDTREIAGLLKNLPYSGVFLMVGTFALLGFPPFGSFFGELLILSALIGSGHMFVFAAFCVLITMTFVATGRTIFPMIWGESKVNRTWPRQTFLSAAPKLCFLLVLVVLGVYIPEAVNRLILQVAASVSGS